MNTAMIKLLLITVLVLTGVGGLYYISNLQANLAIAEENQKQLTQAVETQKETMAAIAADAEAQRELNKSLIVTVKKQQEDVQALNNKFSKLDLGSLAVQKPEVIQKSINKASVKAIRCIELASGAPLNEKEKNAKTPIEANSECPNLISSR